MPQHMKNLNDLKVRALAELNDKTWVELPGFVDLLIDRVVDVVEEAVVPEQGYDSIVPSYNEGSEEMLNDVREAFKQFREGSKELDLDEMGPIRLVKGTKKCDSCLAGFHKEDIIGRCTCL